MNHLTSHKQHDMPYSEGVRHIMDKIIKGVSKVGHDLFDVFVYYPAYGRTVRLTHDRRGERIRSETKAYEVRYEALTRINNHTFDPRDYRKERPHTFDNAITAWLDRNLGSYSPKSQKDYRNRINGVIVPFFQDMDIRDVNGKVLSDFVHHVRQGRTNKTVNNLVTIVKAFYKDMFYQQAIKQMPMFPRALTVQNKAVAWCPLNVLERIVQEVEDSQVREAILTARLQWLRVGEVRGLRWEDIDFDANQMTVRSSFSSSVFRETTKTGKQTVKHLHSTVKGMLAGRVGHGKAFVFTYRGKPLYESLLRKRFNAARDKAGFSSSLTLYGATRHSGATEGYISTGDIRKVQKALGHTDIRTTMKYEHATDTKAVIEPQAEVREINEKIKTR
jgi:integrase